MQQQASTIKSSDSSSTNGAVILKINKNGKLNIYPIGNSDREVAEVLKAFRDALIDGDLWELVA